MSGIIITGIIAVASIFGGAKVVESKYPAQTDVKQIGEKIIHQNKEKIFIGYTGIDEDVAKEIQKNGSKRCLFTTSNKLEAQKYAMTGGRNKPVVMEVWADRFPKSHDLEPQWFEGSHSPISQAGLKNMNVSIHRIEPVNKDTKLGISGAFARMMQEVKKSLSEEK